MTDIQTIEVTVTRLKSSFVCRPKGKLGTCGWHPIAWTATTGKTAATAVKAFENMHPKYRISFVGQE